MTEEATVKLTKDAEAVITKIEKMSIMELNDLVKAMEDKFGVSAAVAVAAPAAAGGDAGGADDGADAKVNVVLASAGDKKIQVLKAVREITGLGLKEAKDLVDACPKPIKEGASKEEADEIKAKIEEQGGKVEIN